MDESGFFFALWFSFRALFITLIILFLLNGLDDLFVDFLFYGRKLYRLVFRRRVVVPVTVERLNAVPEQPAAIMIPAWDESAVIRRMLLNTIGTLHYRNYRIFVGTYPNDEATRMEVEKVREIYANVEAIVTPADGPTNKADCLNWVYQGIRTYEKDHGIRFAYVVMHDAEDVVHPLSLKYYNYLIPRVHFIQLPVFPLEVKWTNLIVGVYMDEFAENHTKDLRAREILTSSLPCAGVGAAASHEAMDYLAIEHQNQVFDIGSLTEDYLMGIKLRGYPGRKIFLQQESVRVEVVRSAGTGSSREKRVVEPIATREYFPSTFAASVRQKSRWILGIGLQGWKFGWTGSLRDDYFLFRDRKSLATNLLVVLGYVVAAYWFICRGVEVARPGLVIPPLIEPHEVYYTMLLGVLGLFGWRIVNRIALTWHIYGWVHGLLAIPRLVVGNIINFWATCLAIQRYVASVRRGKVPEWGKTSHAFPSEDQLRAYHRKLGDLLLEHRLITTVQLDEALAAQRATGKRLGSVLVEMGVLWDEDLVFALARQEDTEAVEIDPYLTPMALLELVPKDLADAQRVFPLGFEGEAVILATDQPDLELAREAAGRRLGRAVTMRRVCAADLDFAIARAYAPGFAPVPAPLRLGQRLVRKGRLSDSDLQQALRRQKRTRQRLGDILVEMNLIGREELEREESGA